MGLFSKLSKNLGPNIDDLAAMLKSSPEALKEFESQYASFLEKYEDGRIANAKQMAKASEGVCCHSEYFERIVNELVGEADVVSFSQGNTVEKKKAIPEFPYVTAEEINSVPAELRPRLTGTLVSRDMDGSAGEMALFIYSKYLTEKNPQIKAQLYGTFRQGIESMDLDPLSYAMLESNPNSMGHWLPFVSKAANDGGFFKVPETKIVKVPLPLLQLSRLDYSSLNRETLDIANEFCKRVFDLDENKKYFVKTGTFSSKFDFRNAKIDDPKEVKELGEYLLYISHQAVEMCSPIGIDEQGRVFSKPVMYGMSPTVEWCVREYIEDPSERPTIYNGLPLRTEYRAFVDFDTNEVFGVHNYWDPEVMEGRFSKADSPSALHDWATYSVAKDELIAEFEKNKGLVKEKLQCLVNDTEGLSGQWSVDVMQSGDDFYLIDMALAENSAYYEQEVPVEKRRPTEEEWLSVLEKKLEIAGKEEDLEEELEP